MTSKGVTKTYPCDPLPDLLLGNGNNTDINIKKNHKLIATHDGKASTRSEFSIYGHEFLEWKTYTKIIETFFR